MSTSSPPKPAHLITALGKGPYARVNYKLRGHDPQESPFACVALARSLPMLALGRASLLLTSEASKAASASELEVELENLGISVARVDIPDGRDETEILTIFNLIQKQIGAGESLVLDVTFGLRHLPFVSLASLAYVGAFKDAKLRGIYYGAHQLMQGGIAPIFDVTPLLQLVRWSYAIESARRWGDFRPLAQEAKTAIDPLHRSAPGKNSLASVRAAASSLAAAFAGGLPLEIGQHGRRLIDALERLPDDVDPLARPVVTALQELTRDIAPVALSDRPRRKEQISLTLDELARELRVARMLLEGGDEPGAVGLLGEWCRNLCLWRRYGSAVDWLRHDPARKRALSWAARWKRHNPMLKRVLALEKRLRGARNRLAHAGFSKEPVGVSPSDVTHLLGEAEAILRQFREDDGAAGEALPSLPGAPGRLLVTPLGLSPGVLYSCVLHVKPDAAVVVTSERARPLVREALEAAESAQLPVRYLVVDDPFFGFDQVRRLARDDEFLSDLDAYGEVIVNLTGGTTALQYGVERLASVAERSGCNVRRVALIDRRSPEEQRTVPYVLSEIVDIGSTDEDDPETRAPRQ